VTGAVETPSGKGATDENFPVASWLIASRLRPHVMAFYAFARAIDDIADNPDLDAAAKIRRLDRMAGALVEGSLDPALATAARLRSSLAATGVGPAHALALVGAFRQDAVKHRYVDWAELMAYCDRSAAPVGRYLLDLHGEAPALYAGSDALCNALQVINHLQDCGEDFRRMDRVYIPEPWLAGEGLTPAALGGPAVDDRLRRVMDRCLDGVDALLDRSRALASRLADRRLAAETAAIQGIAEALARRLRHGDPLARRVVLGKAATLWAGGRGVIAAVLARGRAGWATAGRADGR